MKHSGLGHKFAVAVLLMCGLLVPATSASAIDVGSKCSKVGAMKVVNGNSLRCVKNSRGLKVWQKEKTPILSCEQGGVCVVGFAGPGGGKVFYYSTQAFTSTGSDCGTNCHYLEAAPKDLSIQAWCSNNSFLNVTATDLGSGMSNTTIARGTCTSGAIQSAADYTNNGKSDWYLPSITELHFLYYLKLLVGGFSPDAYWSSTEGKDESDPNYVWTESFANGMWLSLFKHYSYRVRPVRAF